MAFLAAAANLLLMGLADTTVPWPVTLAAVLSPVLLAFLAIGSRVSGPVFGRDGLRVVSGFLGSTASSRSRSRWPALRPDPGSLAVAALLCRLRGSVRRPRQEPSSADPDAGDAHPQ